MHTLERERETEAGRNEQSVGQADSLRKLEQSWVPPGVPLYPPSGDRRGGSG